MERKEIIKNFETIFKTKYNTVNNTFTSKDIIDFAEKILKTSFLHDKHASHGLTCHKCKGLGYISKKQCKNCNGSGHI